MKKAMIIILALVLLGAGVFALTRNNTKSVDSPSATHTEEQSTEGEVEEEGTAVETSEVSIENFAYTPQVIKVKVGTTVTWTNKDSAAHTVTSDTGDMLNSPMLEQGETFSFTFSEAGAYDYHCVPHPDMVGTVIVTE